MTKNGADFSKQFEDGVAVAKHKMQLSLRRETLEKLKSATSAGEIIRALIDHVIDSEIEKEAVNAAIRINAKAKVEIQKFRVKFGPGWEAVDIERMMNALIDKLREE